MAHRLQGTATTLAFVLCGAAWALAADLGASSDRVHCAQPKPLREIAQDETWTIPELCIWRDDSLRWEADHEMTLAQDEPAAAKINLSMEQRHIIKEIVLKDLKPKQAAPGITISIGDAVPAGVEMQPFPPEVSAKVPQVRSHKFFVQDDHVVIVSPKDNVVADVIE